ncbi:MAG: glutaminyl-peptide cyclotransferase [Bacteroidota bacterium]
MIEKLIASIVLLSTLIGCKSEGKNVSEEDKATVQKAPVVVKRSQLLQPQQDTLMILGDQLPLALNFKNEVPISVEASLNGGDRKSIDLTSGRTELPTSGGIIGDNRYVLDLVYPDSTRERVSVSFQLLSNFTPEQKTYQVVNVYPHNEGSFTQGLFYHGGRMYEGSGQEGKSALRAYDLQSGKIFREVYIPPEYFGEGIALLGDVIYQLTYKAKKILLYTADTFTQMGERPWKSEGWGLTTDGEVLIVSDGSAYLYFLDPVSMVEKSKVKVSDGKRFVLRLNELEYIDGKVFANVWESDSIISIDPLSGQVETFMDLRGILPGYSADQQRSKVLNGIAYLPEKNSLLVTGKEWPQMFEIKIQP